MQDRSILSDLITTYGSSAIFNITQEVLEDRVGYEYRWIAVVDGQEIRDIEVKQEERDGQWVLSLVRGADEIAIWRAPEKDALPALFTLGRLQAYVERGDRPREI